MSKLNLLALELTQALFFVYSLFFPPTPSIVFLVAMKKCVMPLLEPLDDHQPKSEMVDVTGGGAEGGIVTMISSILL